MLTQSQCVIPKFSCVSPMIWILNSYRDPSVKFMVFGCISIPTTWKKYLTYNLKEEKFNFSQSFGGFSPLSTISEAKTWPKVARMEQSNIAVE